MSDGRTRAAVAGAAAIGTVGAVLGGAALAARLRRAAHPALMNGPHNVGHRGAAGLAPENTLPSFRRAVEDWGADMLELDVRATADGRCVVIHDPTVDRTTDGSGHVAEMSFDELRRLDAGFRFTPDGGRTYPYRGQGIRVPTLDEVLAAVPDTPIVVEVKTGAAQPGMFDAIRRNGAEHRIIAAGEDDADRTLFHGFDGPISASRQQMKPFYVLHRLRLARFWRPAADVASVPEVWENRRIVTPRFVRDLHRHGIGVQVWTINDPADMRRLLDWGVDAIVTDRPDLLSDVLAERATSRHGERDQAAVRPLE